MDHDSGVCFLSSADAYSTPIRAEHDRLHIYVAAVAGAPVTLQESIDGNIYYDCLDKVNGDSTTGKYVATVGVLPLKTISGAYYRLITKTGDYSSGTSTVRMWG